MFAVLVYISLLFTILFIGVVHNLGELDVEPVCPFSHVVSPSERDCANYFGLVAVRTSAIVIN